ncbi:hypothetical protein CVT26_007283 [Gymnopilus dilepis]|uniref:RRM domain-containing protein n=1 Tax=Gymnopilus dilepis TaxID=231916 RepID=A0A409VLS6_9AGAR|nr:hypothetical protein CVT26_007283 [Gymnopilus dilepis]
MPVYERNSKPYARSNDFYKPKDHVLGHSSKQTQPAWKAANAVGGSPQGSWKGKAVENGSKVFLTGLPVDVAEKDVEELFRKTIGPLKEAFLVYNSQGRSKGMAVVWFHRPGDAGVARAKYDGQIVDGRRRLKVEILLDGMPSSAAPAIKFPTPPSLLDRLAPPPSDAATTESGPSAKPSLRTASRPLNVTPASADEIPIPPRRMKQKKGPKRLKKRMPVTVADLDREMDDYRASATLTSSLISE